MKNCRLFKVITDHRYAMIHYNDGRPWWKKKRPKFFVSANGWFVYDAPPGREFDITKLWIKFEGSEELFPLHQHCEFYDGVGFCDGKNVFN